ncbi:MAG: nucleotidyltransferase family protein [Maricaulaceae bacterium]|nr:nucleotidyltransferase family protein [Maricaulaceae bacterium]
MSVAPHTAMVLAAGLGTRMRPLTDDRPKALVQVGGKALVDWTLDRLGAAGVRRAAVNIHHFADRMLSHLSARGASPRIMISDERDALLETGGGLVRARRLLGDDPVYVCNIDAVWLDGPQAELSRLAAAWDEAEMDVLLLLAPLDNCLGFHGAGDYHMDVDGRLTRARAGAGAPFAYAGAHIVNPRLFDGLKEEKFSLVRIWDALETQGRLYGLPMQAFWMHVGDPAARDAAEARLKAEGYG